MNLVEIKQLTECRRKLNSITPVNLLEQTELTRAKDILDDILEFTDFLGLPDYCEFE